MNISEALIGSRSYDFWWPSEFCGRDGNGRTGRCFWLTRVRFGSLNRCEIRSKEIIWNSIILHISIRALRSRSCDFWWPSCERMGREMKRPTVRMSLNGFSRPVTFALICNSTMTRPPLHQLPFWSVSLLASHISRPPVHQLAFRSSQPTVSRRSTRVNLSPLRHRIETDEVSGEREWALLFEHSHVVSRRCYKFAFCCELLSSLPCAVLVFKNRLLG